MSLVLETLAIGGPRAMKLASVIQALAKAMFDPEVGEFETYQYLNEAGALVTGRTIPRAWWPRLDKAIATDAIEHLSTKRIVEIMLQGPR